MVSSCRHALPPHVSGHGASGARDAYTHRRTIDGLESAPQKIPALSATVRMQAWLRTVRGQGARGQKVTTNFGKGLESRLWMPYTTSYQAPEPNFVLEGAAD